MVHAELHSVTPAQAYGIQCMHVTPQHVYASHHAALWVDVTALTCQLLHVISKDP
jgi:hypothetical protein